jgi:VWFA-related protein
MRRAAGWTLCAGSIAAALATVLLAADPPDNPSDVGLIERASTRLAQIDVTVAGPKGAIEGLTAADFEVRVMDKIVPNVILDDLCIAQPSPPGATPKESPVETRTPAKASAETPRAALATYLLYFDMAHLTQSGRQDSIAAAREMLPKLLAGGNRAMIVANAAQLKTVVPLTSEPARLDAALAKMVEDMGTFDPYAAAEQIRRANVVAGLVGRGSGSALGLAHRYAVDERWRQERDLRRLSMVLGRFAEFDPPKVVLYFADTMRQNPGEHYLSFFGDLRDHNGRQPPEAADILAAAATGALPLDRVINDAAALGIRFYTVEGQGMTSEDSPIQSQGSASSRPRANMASPRANSQNLRDAQGTLVSLAGETGGRAFLNGITPARMATQLLGDLSCLYLLSFDPRSFPQDAPLAVSVRVKRAKVTTFVRGRLVIQSDAERLNGRVLAAFASPAAGTQPGSAGVQVGLIPISYQDGKFKARVQVAVAGSAVPLTNWDIGASLVSRGAVRQDGSGRIKIMRPNTPVVYEKDMDFAPGDYDLIAVAHESETDTVVSREAHGTWPKLDSELASLGPIAVSQRRSGGFLQNGKTQTEGGRDRRRRRAASRRRADRGHRPRLPREGPKEAIASRAHTLRRGRDSRGSNGSRPEQGTLRADRRPHPAEVAWRRPLSFHRLRLIRRERADPRRTGARGAGDPDVGWRTARTVGIVAAVELEERIAAVRRRLRPIVPGIEARSS